MAAQALSNTTLINDANLQGYWKLNGDFVDSKNGYNLTPTGTPTDETGNFSGAKGFSSSSHYAKVAAASSTLLPRVVKSNITMMGWVKFNTVAGALFGYEAATADYMMIEITASNKPTATWNTSGAPSGRQIASTVAVSTGIWYMVTLVSDWSNNLLKIWVNDTKTEVAQNFATATSTGAFYTNFVGASSGDIILDDVSVFDRALTDAEVIAHYNGTDALPPSSGSQSFFMNLLS